METKAELKTKLHADVAEAIKLAQQVNIQSSRETWLALEKLCGVVNELVQLIKTDE